MNCDTHLATGRMHVGRPVLVERDDGAICRRRSGELLDLFAQDRDSLPGGLQGGVQLLVSGICPGQFPTGVGDFRFESTELAGNVDQTTS